MNQKQNSPTAGSAHWQQSQVQQAQPVQRSYKDTLFRMLFNDKEALLSLYNAVGQTDYKDASQLEIVTLENAIYMNMKNDLAFLINLELNLYEHQSTWNPNMPLRDPGNHHSGKCHISAGVYSPADINAPRGGAGIRIGIMSAKADSNPALRLVNES